MSDTTTAAPEDRFVGLAYPVVKVRYAGPTDTQGTRYIATLRRVRHIEHYDYALEGRANAYNAAWACWTKYQNGLPEVFRDDDQRQRVLVPGDLDADSYTFTVVPAGLLAPPTTDDTWKTPTPVTRTDYPGAPCPGDRFGWVICGPGGGHMTEPYRDKARAEELLAAYAPEAHIAHVSLIWPEVQS